MAFGWHFILTMPNWRISLSTTIANRYTCAKTSGIGRPVNEDALAWEAGRKTDWKQSYMR